MNVTIIVSIVEQNLHEAWRYIFMNSLLDMNIIVVSIVQQLSDKKLHLLVRWIIKEIVFPKLFLAFQLQVRENSML